MPPPLPGQAGPARMPPPLPGMGGPAHGPPRLPGMGESARSPLCLVWVECVVHPLCLVWVECVAHLPCLVCPGKRATAYAWWLRNAAAYGKNKKAFKDTTAFRTKAKDKAIQENERFWSELIFKTESDYKTSMWASIDDENPKVDFKDFENAFGKVEKAKPEKGKPKTSSKPKKVSLVDPKRQQNCGIALGRFRMPYDDIRQAIVDVDTTIITQDRTQALIKVSTNC